MSLAPPLRYPSPALVVARAINVQIERDQTSKKHSKIPASASYTREDGA
jgi:hypothetical protein